MSIQARDETSRADRAANFSTLFVPLTGSVAATALPRASEPLNLPAMSDPSSAPPPGAGRLMSIDALRGFDMFWIIAGDALVYALSRMAGEKGEGFSIFKFLAYQLEHADWAGFRFYDLIFPLFVFIVGVSIVFSLIKELEQGGRNAALKRVGRRFLLLFAIAILYSGGFRNAWPDMRLLGVLNQPIGSVA